MTTDDKNKRNQDDGDQEDKGGRGRNVGKIPFSSADLTKIPDEDGDQGGEGGLGGIAGEVGFRYKDAMSIEPRDDALSPAEIKRLLSIHKDIHKSYVDKQRQARKERKLLKEGQTSLTSRAGHSAKRGGYSTGRYSPYKKHPISNKAQFSGIDRQVIGLPSENREQTNEQQRNDLENRYELRLQNAPKFNPKMRPY